MKSYRVTEFEMPLEMVEVPTPKPSGTEVLLRVKAAGVCHSDLHIWEGGYDLGHGKRMSLKDRGIPLPLTMGHETAGEIVALGPQAEGVKPGEVGLVPDCPNIEETTRTHAAQLIAAGVDHVVLDATNMWTREQDAGGGGHRRAPCGVVA